MVDPPLELTLIISSAFSWSSGSDQGTLKPIALLLLISFSTFRSCYEFPLSSQLHSQSLTSILLPPRAVPSHLGLQK